MNTTDSYQSSVRLREGDAETPEKVGAFIQGMIDRENRTRRVAFGSVIDYMDDNGTLNEISGTNEGWRNLCNEMAPGLYSYMKSWETRGMPNDQVLKIQKDTFNTALDARHTQLRSHTVTIFDDPNNGPQLEAIYSPRYKLITNMDILNEVPKVLGGDITVSSMSIKGRQFQAHLTDPSLRKEFRSERAEEGEIINMGYQVRNSEDRSLSVGVSLSAFLQHCTNGMVSEKALHNVSARHIGSTLSLEHVSKLRGQSMEGVIDLVAKSAQVRLDDGSMETHKKWVTKQVNKEYAEQTVNPLTAYRGYHGKNKFPTVFDVFNKITEDAHKKPGLSVEEKISLEKTGTQYVQYAMSAV